MPASNWAIESRRCLTIFSMTASTSASVSSLALVDLALLDRGEQQADRRQARGRLRAHRGLHVFGDAGLEGHRRVLEVGAAKQKGANRFAPSSADTAFDATRQYSFGGSCWLRRRL